MTDNEALIAEARTGPSVIETDYGPMYPVRNEADLVRRLADALEAAERDKREAQAEALEAFAARCDSDWGEFSYIDASGLIGYATVPEMARECAAEIREGRA